MSEKSAVIDHLNNELEYQKKLNKALVDILLTLAEIMKGTGIRE